MKCCKCNNKAVCFFPACDPDIPSYPFCRKCVEKEKIKITMALMKIW